MIAIYIVFPLINTLLKAQPRKKQIRNENIKKIEKRFTCYIKLNKNVKVKLVLKPL